MTTPDDWRIYRGDGVVDPTRLSRLPAPPPWRTFERFAEARARTFAPPPGAVEAVNAALYLRRPVLVTGDPGSGKSSLAYAIARELGLGEVLTWHVNSRSTRLDGLYEYDAVARLRVANLERARDGESGRGERASEDIGRFITLGPLGTAFATPGERPRVVLIDEIDKSDIDLPNDLLHVLEEGTFTIPELARHHEPQVDVYTHDRAHQVTLTAGRVQCRVFPVVVITSNGERELPPAFLRRCLRVDLPTPSVDELRAIVQRHLPAGDQAQLAALLTAFDDQRRKGMMATDQLLNAFYLVSQGRAMTAEDKATVEAILLREIGTR